MIRFALKTLTEHPARLIITSCGIGLCVILILFLMGIYKGVSDGSVEYIRSSDAQLWVLQRHATNILRSTSLLEPRCGKTLKEIEGVSKVSPILFILASVALPRAQETLYMAGYEPDEGMGGPPEIVEGRDIHSNGEIVIDHSFAAKNRIHVGDTLPVKHLKLKVVGFSGGTNMFVIQYAFITLADAHRIIGMAGIVTCYLLKVIPGYDPAAVASEITGRMPDVKAFGKEDFLRNNIREMESGILPLLFSVAVISSVVLSVILSLILSINVLERRKDFAIMKALGSPAGFIPRLVLWQSAILSINGLVIGIMLFFPLSAMVEKLSPEVSLVTTVGQIIVICIMVLIISMLSSVLPNEKLRKVFPLEAFR